MIESIEFTNFKALHKTTVPLAPFTLLLGPNGSGKTTVLQALRAIATVAASNAGIRRRDQFSPSWQSLLSVTADTGDTTVGVKLRLRLGNSHVNAAFQWSQSEDVAPYRLKDESAPGIPKVDFASVWRWLGGIQTYELNPSRLGEPVPVSGAGMDRDGTGLAAVLDDLKDNHPERWEQLLEEMRRWLPEYDHIQFHKPDPGMKRIMLRTKKGGHRIPANELSQGTLVALALLTLAYLPEPPSVIGLEEIDRGLHPRLLRHLQDALYRLSYPESCGEKRPPIQVIATTHSPYLLDLYRDHPEEVVLAEKEGLEVKMTRLADIGHYQEILGDSPLSEVWYSGVLGGVAVKP